MTPSQNLWLTIFNFGPPIALAFLKSWWVGLLALAATFILSWVLAFLVSFKLQGKALVFWAWLKPPVVAAIVFSISWVLF